jgi:hypothetical protein
MSMYVNATTQHVHCAFVILLGNKLFYLRTYLLLTYLLTYLLTNLLTYVRTYILAYLLTYYAIPVGLIQCLS